MFCIQFNLFYFGFRIYDFGCTISDLHEFRRADLRFRIYLRTLLPFIPKSYIRNPKFSHSVLSASTGISFSAFLAGHKADRTAVMMTNTAVKRINPGFTSG